MTHFPATDGSDNVHLPPIMAGHRAGPSPAAAGRAADVRATGGVPARDPVRELSDRRGGRRGCDEAVGLQRGSEREKNGKKKKERKWLWIY